MKNYTPRLKDKYINEVIPSLQSKMGYSNIMEVPKLNKICINQGVGQAVNDKKLIELASDEMIDSNIQACKLGPVFYSNE